MASNQLEYIFDSLPDSVIACDYEGKILRINAAAMKLFEVASEPLYRGTYCRQFLHHYEIGDDQQLAISLDPWLMSLITGEKLASGSQEEFIVLQVPSGKKVYVNMREIPMLDAQKHAVGMVYVFHDTTRRYQKALRLQRVHQAVITLSEAIAHIPEHIDLAFNEVTLLLSPPVLLIAQQLVNVIGQVLDCHAVSLQALGPEGRLYYAVGSGFTSEQEQYRREMRGYYSPTEYFDEAVSARLSANKEAIVSTDHVRLPPGFQADFGAGNLLLIPIFLEKQLAGLLVISKIGFDSEYTPEEIELVKAVTTQTVLFIECLHYLYEQAETRARALVRQEMNRLINEFLNFASHELNTPLTSIKGNIQLAQRRLEKLKRQVAEQFGEASKIIKQVQQPLGSAAQSARLQERMIRDLIDDAHIQANTLELHMKRFDLIALLKEAVANQQRSEPERTIVLNIKPTENVVPIIADADRITQVINSYLANALSYSPANRPVTVQLAIEDAVARVSVRDKGPGIPLEEQERIWKRFYYAKGIAAQHRHDLGLGLGLYFCRAFIERHHGSVGVESIPGHGATFWFTLPIEASPGE